MNSDVIGSSVQGDPVVYITAFVVLVLLAFARPWAESLVALARVGGYAVAAVLLGSGVAKLKIKESDESRPSAEISRVGSGASTYLIGLLGFLTPPLLGLAGAYLVLSGLAWSLLWVVLVLLFAAYLKAEDWFTIVVVLLVGAGIGWTVVQGTPGLQAGVAVAVVWLLLLGGVSTLFGVSRKDSSNSGSGEEKKTKNLVPGTLGLALVWFVAILALWVGGRRLLGL